jgi:hypothetical protein
MIGKSGSGAGEYGPKWQGTPDERRKVQFVGHDFPLSRRVSAG